MDSNKGWLTQRMLHFNGGRAVCGPLFFYGTTLLPPLHLPTLLYCMTSLYDFFHKFKTKIPQNGFIKRQYALW